MFLPTGISLSRVSFCSLRKIFVEVVLNGGCSSAVEPRIVIPVVAGSNPVSHPAFFSDSFQILFRFFPDSFQISLFSTNLAESPLQ